jgi:hypothetical protein
MGFSKGWGKAMVIFMQKINIFTQENPPERDGHLRLSHLENTRGQINSKGTN